ncbi:hypothetical protein D9M72_629070 [compost metagenome]
MVVVLRDGGGAEGVGFDQVRAGGQVAFVDLLDHLRLRQRQQLVVTLDEQLARTAVGRSREVGEAAGWAATVSHFIQLVLLDDGAHRAVQEHDALGEHVAQLGFGLGIAWLAGFVVHFVLSRRG